MCSWRGTPRSTSRWLSIPDINQLWAIFTSPLPTHETRCYPLVRFPCLPGTAREPALDRTRPTWTAGPRSAQQVIDYNGALAEVCAEFKRCLFDNNAVFNSRFTAADVATVTNTAVCIFSFTPFQLSCRPIFNPRGLLPPFASGTGQPRGDLLGRHFPDGLTGPPSWDVDDPRSRRAAGVGKPPLWTRSGAWHERGALSIRRSEPVAASANRVEQPEEAPVP